MTGDVNQATLDRLSPERRQLIELMLRRQRAEADAGDGVPVDPEPDGGKPPPPYISVFFFSADNDDKVRDKHQVVLECAEVADEGGLHAVWMPERHFDPFGAPYPSPSLLLAALAVRTSRIQLRAGSVVLPLHDPVLVAEDWGVLDSLSGGRMGLSLASGWHVDDFVLDPDAYEDRRQVLRDRLEDLKTLWAGGSVTRVAPGGRTVAVKVFPRPERTPELWLTSSSNPVTWRTAAQMDMHVLTALLEQSVDELAAKVEGYRSELRALGRDPAGRRITCMVHTHLAEDPGAVEHLVREPLKRYLAAHLKLFAKFAQSQNVRVRPEDVTDADREVLLEHGFRRYFEKAGLFGSVETCLPMVERLAAAGVTEIGCLVDFGLPRDQVVDCVRRLGELNARLHSAVGAGR